MKITPKLYKKLSKPPIEQIDFRMHRPTERNELYSNLMFQLDEVYKLEDGTINNELIAEYYETINQPEKAKNVRRCGRSLFFNEYNLQRVNDLQNVFLCKDPFCINCQKYKARMRLLKYLPTIEKIKETHDLYMLTVAPRNCSAEEYNNVVDIMNSSFSTFVRYLTGNAKIKNIDFSYLDYVGCVRAFETTFNLSKRYEGLEYHPHFHIMLALSKDLFLKRDTINDYSYKYKTVYEDGKRRRRKITRSFSQLEIDIQKIWYLLMNGQKVTAKAIQELPLGYSCTLDKADDKAALEVFKYAIKSFDENQQHIDLSQFMTLHDALKGRRAIEGYGIFRDMIKKSAEEEINQDIIMHVYDSVIAALNLTEKPRYGVFKSLNDVKGEMLYGDTIFINRRAIFSATEKTRNEMLNLVNTLLYQHNQRRGSYKVTIEDFFDRIMRKQDERKRHFDFLQQQNQAKQKQYTERSKARTRYVKQQLKKLNIDRTSSLYASSVLHLKVEYNNKHPHAPRPDITGANLPF